MPFTVTMPKLSPTMDAGTIAVWHVKENEYVEADQLLMEVATDKATVEYLAIDPGYVRKILVPAGQEAIVNQPIAIFSEEKEESLEGYTPEGEIASESEAVKEEAKKPSQESEPSEPTEKASQQRVKASPLARVLAKKKGIDLTRVNGSGPRGRIMSRDLEEVQATEETTFPPGSFTEVPLSPMRKVIGSRLQASKRDIPHFYLTATADVTTLLSLRASLKERGETITVNDFIVKACALSLKDHPEINCGFDPKKNILLKFNSVDISVAVELEEGLITPIVPSADRLSLRVLSSTIKTLAKKAREGKLQPHEFEGGSFTISNLGMFGIEQFSAVINPPQGAILAVGAAQTVPAFEEGQVVPKQSLSLVLSVDHRIIDGGHAARFMQTVKGYLEKPAVLLL